MRRLYIVSALLCLCHLMATAGEPFYENCFGVVAGKNVTTDGSVLFGHNEDDGGEQMLNIYRGADFLWAEFPGMSASDTFLNKWGVAVASDNCMSREDREDLTDGGILYELRLHVAQRATSARDAVRVISEDVQKYGYRGSGRTYIVADASEAWLVSVVKGRHWVAQRVPDDMVMTIPNYYVISHVDLSDTLNFAGSPDIIDYAIERGWYDPGTDGEFSFRNAYASENTYSRRSNLGRHSRTLDLVAGEKYPYDVMTAPFAIKPSRKFSLQDVMEILDQHDEPDSTGKHSPLTCASTTVVSTIFQLRADMPVGVGNVMWTCPGHPCAGVYFPLYLGQTDIPAEWHRFQTVDEALEKHLSDGKDLRTNYPDGAYWCYVDRWTALDEAGYETGIQELQGRRDELQRRIFARQARLERRLCRMGEKRAARVLRRQSRRWMKSASGL